MAKWNKQDEKKFQSLLKRRQVFTTKLINDKLSDEFIQAFVEQHEDDMGQDWWEAYVDNASPSEIEALIEAGKEFDAGYSSK